MYLVLKEGVSIGTFQYEGSDTTHHCIENADGEEFEISRRLWDALLKADSTRPLDLPDNGRRILPKLKRHGLVRTSRFVQDDGIFNRFILFPIGNRTRTDRPVFRAINAALPAVSILTFAIGIYVMASEGAGSGYNFSWWLYYGLIALSLAFHELGHFVAGLAYGDRISDTGILFLGIIPLGACVAHHDEKDATKTEKIRLSRRPQLSITRIVAEMENRRFAEQIGGHLHGELPHTALWVVGFPEMTWRTLRPNTSSENPI